MTTSSDTQKAPCGANFHGLRPGNPDCGCGWGELCDFEEPVHRPKADPPIPGEHWYSGCDPDRPTVGPDGKCRGCGETACVECGRSNCPDHQQWADLYVEAEAREDYRHDEDNDES